MKAFFTIPWMSQVVFYVLSFLFVYVYSFVLLISFKCRHCISSFIFRACCGCCCCKSFMAVFNLWKPPFMISKIASNWTYALLSSVSVFVMYPFCLRVLGPDQYGLWLLLSSVTGYFSILQLGVPMANVKFISKYFAKNDFVKLSEIVSTNFFFFSSVGFLVVLIGLVISCFVARLFTIDSSLVTEAQSVVVLLSINIGLGFAFEVFEGILHGVQLFVFLNILKNILLIIRVVCVLLFLSHDRGLYVLSVVLIFITSLQGVVLYLYLRRKMPSITISFKYASFETFKTVFSFSFFVIIMQFSMRLSFNTDSIVVGQVVSIDSIVYFAAGATFLGYLLHFVSGVSHVLVPSVSGYVARGELLKVRSLFSDSIYGTTLIVIPVCLTLIFFGPDFIALWIGERFRIISGDVLTILTMSYLFFLVQWGVSYSLLMGSSHVRFPTIVMASSAILNVVLSLVFGSMWGLNGVALGTSLPNILNSTIIAIYSCRVFKLGLRLYLVKFFIVPYSSCVFIVIPCLLIKSYVVIDSYLSLATSVLFSLSSYVFFVYVFYLDARHKLIFKNVFASKS